MKATSGRGVDVAYDTAGSNAALANAVNVARPGGRVVIVGIPVDENTTFNASVARSKGLSILLQRRSHAVYARAIRMVNRGQIDVRSLVSHTFPLADTKKAFEFAEQRTGLKVVITP